ncbi:hypothetical protein D3C79_787700 [compost metagenome]
MKIGAAIGQRQGAELLGTTEHGGALGLQLVTCVEADLEQHHQPTLGAGISQRLIRVGDGILLHHMGRRGGDAPVRMGQIVDKVDHQQCLVHPFAPRLSVSVQPLRPPTSPKMLPWGNIKH